jgi:hypothetical protein
MEWTTLLRAGPAVCLILLTACKAAPTGPSAPLDSEFTLAPDGTMSISGTSLVVRFNGVSGDSRCPADVFCIQGGSAAVRITAASARSTHDYELHTGDMRPVVHEGFSIALIQLSPYPFSSRTILPGEYRATLKVTRSP